MLGLRLAAGGLLARLATTVGMTVAASGWLTDGCPTRVDRRLRGEAVAGVLSVTCIEKAIDRLGISSGILRGGGNGKLGRAGMGISSGNPGGGGRGSIPGICGGSTMGAGGRGSPTGAGGGGGGRAAAAVDVVRTA